MSLDDDSRLTAETERDGGAGPRARRRGGGQAPALRGRAAPPAKPDPEERARRRAEELERMARAERALARRRRARIAEIAARFAGLVVLPTLAVGVYQYVYATDLYVAESAFVVKTAEAPSPAVEGLLAGVGATPGASLQDSISVQDFLLSREAVARLERDLGIVAHFRSDRLDPVSRLPADASMEEVHAYFGDMIEVSYDPAEAVIRMEVAAATPEMARAISARLIGYGEEMVDGLSARLRGDALREAEAAVELAREALEDAHLRAAEVQQELRVFSVEAEAGGEASIIQALEMEVEALRGRLDELLTYAAENDPRAVDLRREIAFKRRQIAERRSNVVGDGAGAGAGSLAAVNVELRRAEAEIETRRALFMSAMASLEAARLEAQRQNRYLAEIVPPALADEAARPRRARNTALAFAAFFGLFMLVSLTLSVLREQIRL